MDLSESFERSSSRYQEGLISAISAGFFFVLVGAIFITTPNLFGKILDFFQDDWGLVRVPNLGSVFLPAPAHPLTHRVVYRAVEQFSLIWGLFQIVILALRFFARSPWGKRAETVSNIVFWLGASFLIRTFLIETIRLPLLSEVARWFVFWSGIIMLIGVSLIIRAIILAAAPRKSVT